MKAHKLSHQNLFKRLESQFEAASPEKWRAAAEKLLKGKSFDNALLTETIEAIVLQPIYWQADVEDLKFTKSLPGFAPHVRGRRASGHVAARWEVAQEIAEQLPADFNKALRHDLARGQTAINLRLNHATLLARDIDQHESAADEQGMPFSILQDFEAALKAVDLEQTPFYAAAGASGIFFTSIFAAFCKKNNVNLAALRGGIGSDPVGELARVGQLSAPIDLLYNEIAMLTEWSKHAAPQLRTMIIRADLYRESGGDVVQELAFAMATGTEYLREMISRGISIDEIAPRIWCNFGVGSNFFMEIAKQRAARMIWRQIVEAFNGNAQSQKLFIHVKTLLWNKTKYDPHVNLLRTTTEALAAIMGGCDSLHVGAFDETTRQPDEFSRRIARNIHLILEAESHVDRVIDPVGGSWYIESLTTEIAEKAWTLFQEIEKKGGMAAALELGFPQQMVEKTAKKQTERLAFRRDKLVGINMYANPAETLLQGRLVDLEKNYQQQKSALDAHRKQRDQKAVRACLEKAAADPKMIVEALTAAASAGATIDELRNALRGDQLETARAKPLRFHRAAEIFENLRDAMTAYQKKHGETPTVFLANIGELSQYKPRADFARSFFEIGGFSVHESEGLEAGSVVEAVQKEMPGIAVICAGDEHFPETLKTVARQIKAKTADIILFVAGNPQAHKVTLQRAGIDGFIHKGCQVHQILKDTMQKSGIID